MTAPGEFPFGGSSFARRALISTGLLVAAGLLALSVVGVIPTTVVLIANAFLIGVVLVGLAVVRFEAFILTLLVIRSSLDLAKTTAVGSPVTDAASLVALLMIGASVAWLVAQRGTAPRQPFSLLSFGLVLFNVAVGISVIGSVEIGFSTGVFLRILAGTLMYFVVVRLLYSGMTLRRLIMALFASTIVPVLLPAVGMVTSTDFTRVKDGVDALASTFFLSNNFAHFLVPFLIIGFAIRNRLPSVRGRWILSAFLVIGLVELVYTNTRGAWVALVIGVLVVGFIQNKAALIGTIATVVLVIILVPTVNQRLADLGSDPDRPRVENSWTWRLEHWENIVTLAADTPVTGIGTGMTARLALNGKEPHNDYLRAYVETGYLGLGAYLLSVIGFVWVAHRSRSRARSDFEKALTVGIFAFAIAIAVSSIAENLITGVVWLWYAMPLAAIANWIAYRDRHPSGPEEPLSPIPESASALPRPRG